MTKFWARLFGGWRIQIEKITVRIMPLRWYVGIGITITYLSFNLGPIQIYFNWSDWTARTILREQSFVDEAMEKMRNG